jgi:ATP-dependent Lon protease
VASEEAKTVKITPEQVEEFLGPARFMQDMAEKSPKIGVVPGLAWTSTGGDILFIEATAMPGKKELTLTGQLGDVMKESVMTALSYLRSISDKIGIDQNYFKDHDFHIHVPAGATPKDGPSAGVTMFTALASLACKKPVVPYTAMTGEITLRGEVLPIGGLKQKALAAYRAGIRKVLIPKRNEKDLREIPREICKKVKFIMIETVEELLENALDMKLKIPGRKRIAKKAAAIKKTAKRKSAKNKAKGKRK